MVCSSGGPVGPDHRGVRCRLISTLGFAKEAEWLVSPSCGTDYQLSCVTSVSLIPFPVPAPHAPVPGGSHMPDIQRCSSATLSLPLCSCCLSYPFQPLLVSRFRPSSVWLSVPLLPASLLLLDSGIHLPVPSLTLTRFFVFFF